MNSHMSSARKWQEVAGRSKKHCSRRGNQNADQLQIDAQRRGSCSSSLLLLPWSGNAHHCGMAPQYDEEAAPLLPGHPPHLDLSISDAERKKWRGGLLCCFSGCDQLAWASATLSCLPGIAFGFNVKRSLGYSWWRAFFFVLLFGFTGHQLFLSSAQYAVNKCFVDIPSDSRTSECSDAASQMIAAGIVMAVLMSFGAVYAAHHRSQIRKKFGIAGSRLGDFCAWYWCGTCALCQETRTLWHNNVVDGVWLGPIKSASNPRPQTLPCYTAPAGTKMSG